MRFTNKKAFAIIQSFVSVRLLRHPSCGKNHFKLSNNPSKNSKKFKNSFWNKSANKNCEKTTLKSSSRTYKILNKFTGNVNHIENTPLNCQCNSTDLENLEK